MGTHVELLEGDVERNQGQQEGRHGQTQKTDKGPEVIQQRILVGGGQDANGYCHHPDEYGRGQRNRHGQRYTFRQQFGNGRLILEGNTKVTVDYDAAQPNQVLDIHGFVQSEKTLQGLDFLFGHRRAGRLQLHDIEGKVIARRQLDQGKGDDGDNNQQGYQDQDAAHNVDKQRNSPSTGRDPVTLWPMTLEPSRVRANSFAVQKPAESPTL